MIIVMCQDTLTINAGVSQEANETVNFKKMEFCMLSAPIDKVLTGNSATE